MLTLVCLLVRGATEQIHEGLGWSFIPLTQEERKLLVRGCLFSFCKCDTEDLWGQLCDEGLLIPTAVQAPYQHEGIHLVWDSDYYHYTNTIPLLLNVYYILYFVVVV